MFGIPRPGKTSAPLGLPDQDTLCRRCGKPSSKLCSACKIRAYCSKEHQIEDWKSHKSECLHFRKLKEEFNSEEEKQEFFDARKELEICKEIWPKYDTSDKKYLENEVADNFLKEVIGISVNITLTEKNLSEIFKQEYPGVALPPQLFFTQQKEHIKEQIRQDIWKFADPESTGKLHWNKVEAFVTKFFQEPDPSSGPKKSNLFSNLDKKSE